MFGITFGNLLVILVMLPVAVLCIIASTFLRRRRELDSQYHLIVDNLGVGVYRVSPEGRILDLNPAMVKLFGFNTPREMLRCHAADLYVDPAERESFNRELTAEGELKERPFLMKKKSGDSFLASVSATATLTRGRKLKYIDGVVKDITDPRSTEKERVRLANLESLGLMVGGIAHDFNNMLAVIVGNLGLARMVRGKEREKILKEAERAGIQAQGLSRQLLTYARGREIAMIGPHPVEATIRERAEFVLRGSRSSVSFEFDADLLPARIEPDQLKQIVQNLVINAEQSMPEGGKITIRAANELVDGMEGVEAGEYVRVTVEDHGEGISPETMSQIFNPYYSTREGSTGLGLSVVQSIIREHGGILTVDSTEGKGTKFVCYLPAEEATVEERKVPATRIVRGSGSVLLIDDDRRIGETLSVILEKLGYEPDYVASSAEGVKRYAGKSPPYDLVITDLTIPGDITGVEVKDRIREINEGAKIIVTSGYFNNPVMTRWKEHGFSGVLTKPYKVETMASLLHQVRGGEGKAQG